MTSAEFKSRYPQFASSGLIETLLAEAQLIIGPGFGIRADMCQGLYVAHYCQVEAEERAKATAAPTATFAGDIVSKSAGKLSITRSGEAIAARLKDPMMATTYGQRFAFYRKLAGQGAVAAGAHISDNSGLSEPDDIGAIPGEGGSELL